MRRPGGCAESAARKERLRLAEAQGELEESAAHMVRASLAHLDTEQALPLSPLPTSQPCIPIGSRLGPLPEKTIASSSRMPILDRLGPLLDEVTTEENAIPPQPQKRKPGRPLGKRRVNASPLALLGTSAKRRTGQHTKPPTCRKKLSVEADPRGKVTKARKVKKAATNSGIPRDEEDNASDNVPICNLIPPSSRRMMDFRVQSNPAP